MGFEWLPEYDSVLERIASTDTVDTEWPKLRDILKYKIDKNITLWLTQWTPTPSLPTITAPRVTANGGLRLPPFPSRGRYTSRYETPRSALSPSEAKDFKSTIFKQLDELDGPPFTIQRVCELCLHPQKHYRYLGKYLRAVDKTLFVTSTWDMFPLPLEGGTTSAINISGSISSASQGSAPPTPLFSPIPFLHTDRRSRSRSPPPSPLVLPALAAGGSATATPHAGTEEAEPKAYYLVDELDDPSPTHLSEHPHALTATTTIEEKSSSKPLLGSLEERFVPAKTEEPSNTEHAKEGPDPSPPKVSESVAQEDPEKEDKQ